VPPAVQELLIAKARRLSGWPAEGAALSLRKKNYLTLAKSYLEREAGLQPATLCLGNRWVASLADPDALRQFLPEKRSFRASDSGRAEHLIVSRILTARQAI